VGAKFHNPDLSPEETRPYTQEDTGYREFKLKLSKVKDRLLTAEGRRMAEERHAPKSAMHSWRSTLSVFFKNMRVKNKACVNPLPN
jgi:hypothetical protein